MASILNFSPIISRWNSWSHLINYIYRQPIQVNLSWKQFHQNLDATVGLTFHLFGSSWVWINNDSFCSDSSQTILIQLILDPNWNESVFRANPIWATHILSDPFCSQPFSDPYSFVDPNSDSISDPSDLDSNFILFSPEWISFLKKLFFIKPINSFHLFYTQFLFFTHLVLF